MPCAATPALPAAQPKQNDLHLLATALFVRDTPVALFGSSGFAQTHSKRVLRMNTREESRAKRDETQTDRQRAAHWLWGGLVALAVVFAALLTVCTIVVHFAYRASR
jgi:hypothetical protein